MVNAHASETTSLDSRCGVTSIAISAVLAPHITRFTSHPTFPSLHTFGNIDHNMAKNALTTMQFGIEPVRTMARTQVVIESWRNPRDLSLLRDCFYKSSDPNLRRQGCDLVITWEALGRAPHAVTATAELTNALLCVHDGRIPVITRVNTFCTAWVR